MRIRELNTVWVITVLLLTTCLKLSQQYECSTDCVCNSFDYICDQCDEGYSKRGSKCLPCTQNCRVCTGSNGTCTIGNCLGESTLMSASGLCKQCAADCITCSDTILPCTTCKYPSYVYDANAKKCVQDTANCAPAKCIKCTSTAPKQCLECLPGYFAFDNVCHPCKYPCNNCILRMEDSLGVYKNFVDPFLQDYFYTAYPTGTFYLVNDYFRQSNLFTIYLLILLVNPNADDEIKATII